MARTIARVFVEQMQACPKEEYEIQLNLNIMPVKAKGKQNSEPKHFDAVIATNSKLSSSGTPTNFVSTISSSQAVPGSTNTLATISAVSPSNLGHCNYFTSPDTVARINELRKGKRQLQDVFEMKYAKMLHKEAPQSNSPVREVIDSNSSTDTSESSSDSEVENLLKEIKRCVEEILKNCRKNKKKVKKVNEEIDIKSTAASVLSPLYRLPPAPVPAEKSQQKLRKQNKTKNTLSSSSDHEDLLALKMQHLKKKANRISEEIHKLESSRKNKKKVKKLSDLVNEEINIKSTTERASVLSPLYRLPPTPVPAEKSQQKSRKQN